MTLVVLLLIQLPFLRALAADVQQETEPNDNPETATQLQPGSIEGSVGSGDDSEDWLIAANVLNHDYTGAVSFNIEYDESACVIDFGISWDGAMVTSTEGTTDTYLGLQYAPSEFYIRVFATEGSGSYTLNYYQELVDCDYGVCMPFGCF